MMTDTNNIINKTIAINTLFNIILGKEKKAMNFSIVYQNL